MVGPTRLTERADRTGSLRGVPVVSVEPMDGHDVEEEFKRNLLLVAWIRVVVVSVSLIVIFALVQLNPPWEASQIQSWQYALIGTTYGLSIVYALALRYGKAALLLAYAQIGLDALIVSVLVLMTGGVESVFGFAYVFCILGGAVTLYRRGGRLAVVVTIGMYGAVIAAQMLQLLSVLPVVRPTSALISLAVHAVGMAAVAELSSTLAQKLRDTGRALAEKEVDYEQLQQMHAAILRSLPAGLVTVDAGGTIRYANDAAVNILRISLRDLVGQPLEVVVPGMRKAWVRWSEDPIAGRERHETSYERAEGVRLRLGFSFAPLDIVHGKVSGTIVVFQDVTDIVMLKEAVERAERLATVGKFAAGLAHEVRNPLASMCASIDVLSSTLEPPPPLQRLMSNVVEEADRLNRLITDFLALARPRSLQLERHELGAIVESVLEVFRQEAAHVTIETEIDAGVVAIVDEDLLRQVLWNLVRNAADALRPAGGTLWVRVALNGEEPVMTVEDDGPGMSSEQLRRVFDPFYTTKAGGSGLGLAISHSIVEAHGAALDVTSAEGEGTRVTIRFKPPSEQVAVDTSDIGGMMASMRGV